MVPGLNGSRPAPYYWGDKPFAAHPVALARKLQPKGEVLPRYLRAGQPRIRPRPAVQGRRRQPICITVPEVGVFCAMDYHLDWLYASLAIAADSTREVFTAPG